MRIEFADGQPMTEDEIRAAAAMELRDNRRYMDDELRENWRRAYRYYKGDEPLPDQAYDSEAISTDVADVLEWMLPAILKPLIESPDVVRFDPVHPEDQDQADLESDYVHHILMKKCNGFLKLYVHVKDALLLKNAIFATYWDDGVDHQVERYRNLNEVELADLLSPADNSEVRIMESVGREVPVLDPSTGQPLELPAAQAVSPSPASPQGASAPSQPPPTPRAPVETPTQVLYDVTIRRFERKGRPVVENIPPENFRVRFSHDSLDLEDARWCAYTMVKTRSELLADGYSEDLLREIVGDTRRYWDNEVRWSREDVEREENSMQADRNETGDPGQDPIDVHRVYMTLDADGDGYQEKYMVILAGTGGEVLLDYYEVPENPFSASSPFIAGHKFYGYSLFDKLKDLADHKTNLLRMLEDNLALINNPRKKAVTGMANIDDLLINQVGGIWRMDQLDAVQEIETPNIAPNAFAILEYYDKRRSERTGIDPNAQSISEKMPEESMNHAMERVLSMKEELVGLIIRVFGETGVKSMMYKLRNLLLRYMPREEIVQLRNKWVVVNPGNWVERTNTTVVVGLGTGDRIRKTQGLMGIFGIQKELMQGGMMGPMVSPERMNHTIAELIRVQGLGDPDDYVLDPALLDPRNPNSMTPRGQEAMRAMQMQQQQQQRQMQMEQAQQRMQMETQKMLVAVQERVAQIQQQGRVQAELIKAQEQRQQGALSMQADARKAQFDMAQFIEEMRLKWAELAESSSASEAQTAAQVATSVMQRQGSMQERQENRDDKALLEGAGLVERAMDRAESARQADQAARNESEGEE